MKLLLDRLQKCDYKIILPLLFSIAAFILVISINSLMVTSDSADYIASARSILRDGSFTGAGGRPMVFWPPFYPFILAITLFAVKGNGLAAALVLNALTGALVIFLVSRWMFHRFHGSVAFFTGFLALVCYPLARMASFALSELTFCLLFFLVFLSYQNFLEARSKKSILYVSLWMALAILTKYMGLILLFIVVLNLFLVKGLKNKVPTLLLFSTTAIIPISIWLLRNRLLSGQFMYGGYLGDPAAGSFLVNFRHGLVIVAGWLLPLKSGIALMIVSVLLFVLFVFFSFKIVTTRHDGVLLFIVTVSALFFLLLIAAVSYLRITTTNIDKYLPPLFPFVFILLAILLEKCLFSLKDKKTLGKNRMFLLFIVLGPLLFYSGRHAVQQYGNLHHRVTLIEKLTHSEVVRYLQSAAFGIKKNKVPLYSNNHTAVLIHADLNCRLVHTRGGKNRIVLWPEKSVMYVDFKKKFRRRGVSIQALTALVDSKKMFASDQADVYWLTKK